MTRTTRSTFRRSCGGEHRRLILSDPLSSVWAQGVFLVGGRLRQLALRRVRAACEWGPVGRCRYVGTVVALAVSLVRRRLARLWFVGGWGACGGVAVASTARGSEQKRLAFGLATARLRHRGSEWLPSPTPRSTCFRPPSLRSGLHLAAPAPSPRPDLAFTPPRLHPAPPRRRPACALAPSTP